MTSSTINRQTSLYTSATNHGLAIAPITHTVRALRRHKLTHKNTTKLAKNEIQQIQSEIHRIESRHTFNGINFSRLQASEIVATYKNGGQIEFETLGPYLADYINYDGVMAYDNLLAEDKIGLELAKVFHELFPKARLVAFCDDYNVISAHTRYTVTDTPEQDSLPLATFSATHRQIFKQSLVTLFKQVGAIEKSAKAGKDYLLVEESNKAKDAEKLVNYLEARGCIRRKGAEIAFFSELTENPLCQTFTLRTKQGRWLCEALDAASFLKPQNTTITHIVVLPDYMRVQQDRVWEILRLIGFLPERYHNIFYDSTYDTLKITESVRTIFEAIKDE